jgi:hypothetical protein
MTDKPKQTDELVELDLSGSASEQQVIDEFTKLGKVQILAVNSYDKGKEFFADVTGQRGRYEFIVQGADVEYSFGADLVMKLVKAIGANSPVMTSKVALECKRDKHFSKLKSANKRQ